MSLGLPARESLDYAPFWCEENVHRLLSRPELGERAAWALLVRNAAGRVAVLRQRAGRGAPGLVVWDYHALALVAAPPESGAAGLLALDLDSTLAFPCPASLWLGRSFPLSPPPGLEPLFRLVSAREYVEELSSDRSHMRGPEGAWKAPPPPWDPPGSGRAPNLLDWLDPSREEPGRILDRKALARFIAAASLAPPGSRGA